VVKKNVVEVEFPRERPEVVGAGEEVLERSLTRRPVGFRRAMTTVDRSASARRS